MFKRMLDGRSVRVPFIGRVSTEVAKSDWRRDTGLPGQPARAFFTSYREEGSAETFYQAGWLQVILESQPEAANAVVKVMGWLLASRFAIAKATFLLILGT